MIPSTVLKLPLPTNSMALGEKKIRNNKASVVQQTMNKPVKEKKDERSVVG